MNGRQNRISIYKINNLEDKEQIENSLTKKLKLEYKIYNSMHRVTTQSSTIDVDIIISKLLKIEVYNNSAEFPLTEPEIDTLCHLTRISMSGQPMLLELKPPVNICGDIHGQYRDLLTLITRIGDPSQQNYLFLGDYVDRGKRSLQTFCLLMAYKVKHPNNFFLLRGNHQCSQVNKIYGFYDQVKRKFNIKLWKNICDTFDYLPIAAVVGDRIFCVHGGLSPQLKNIRDLNAIKRPVEPLKTSALCDMLWSDPSMLLQGWNQNIDRGVSYYFGPNVMDVFLKKYDFDLICRSHQVVEQGYQFLNQRKLLTVFSAPNYCGDFQNLGAVLRVDSNMKCSIQQFQSVSFSNVIKKPKRSLTPLPQQKRQLSPTMKGKTIMKDFKEDSYKRKQTQETDKQNGDKKVQQANRTKNRKVTNLYMLKKQLEFNKEHSIPESEELKSNEKNSPNDNMNSI